MCSTIFCSSLLISNHLTMCKTYTKKQTEKVFLFKKSVSHIFSVDSVKYAGSYLDSLLVLHYLALLLMELRHRQPIYLIRVIR